MKILFLCLIILCTSCAFQRNSYIPGSRAYSSASFSTEGRRYYVKKGDSLWAISKRYGVSVQQLMKQNRITSPRDLKVGQVLIIPNKYYNVANTRYSSDSFSWPLRGEVISFFGESMDNVINKGVNVKAKQDNCVNASAAGKVVFNDYLKGWGQTLILKHPLDFYTIYANIARDSVKEGQYVKAGEAIGQIAQDADGDCILHFEIRKQHLPQNPLEYLE